jgi:hypothetical protein
MIIARSAKKPLHLVKYQMKRLPLTVGTTGFEPATP